MYYFLRGGIKKKKNDRAFDRDRGLCGVGLLVFLLLQQQTKRQDEQRLAALDAVKVGAVETLHAILGGAAEHPTDGLQHAATRGEFSAGGYELHGSRIGQHHYVGLPKTEPDQR